MPTPKVARNLGTLTFHRYRENRRISTIRFQTLKYTKGNYVRHFWGTTPATPAARDGRHNSTRRHTRYGALHPSLGAAPVTRRYTRYEAAPPITRTNAESARRGPGCGARGRWRGLAGQRTNNEPDRLEAAAGPAGPGRASSRRAERSSRRGRRAGGQATRRPEICRGNEQREAARPSAAAQPQLSRRSRWRRRGRPRR